MPDLKLKRIKITMQTMEDKQTTFVIKIMADDWKTEGSPDVWEALEILRNHGNVEVMNTIHGSLPNNINIQGTDYNKAVLDLDTKEILT